MRSPCRLLWLHHSLPRHLARLSPADRPSSASAFLVERRTKTQPQTPPSLSACCCSVLFTDQLHAYHVCGPSHVAGLLVCHGLQTLDDALLSLAFVQPTFIAAVRIFHLCNLLNAGFATDCDIDLAVRLFRQV